MQFRRWSDQYFYYADYESGEQKEEGDEEATSVGFELS